MQNLLQLTCCYLLAAIVLVSGVKASCRMHVDGKQVTWRVCHLANTVHKNFPINARMLKDDSIFTLRLAQWRITSLLRKLRVKFSDLSHVITLMERQNSVKNVCNFDLSVGRSVDRRLSLLRRAAECLRVSRYRQHQFFISCSICSLEAISRLSGNSPCETTRQDVIQSLWRSENGKNGATHLRVRDYLILRDVSKALKTVLQQSKQTV